MNAILVENAVNAQTVVVDLAVVVVANYQLTPKASRSLSQTGTTLMKMQKFMNEGSGVESSLYTECDVYRKTTHHTPDDAVHRLVTFRHFKALPRVHTLMVFRSEET